MNSLRARWSKRDKDMLYIYPSAPDGHLLNYTFSCGRRNIEGGYDKSFIEELEARGYDLTTLRFSVKRKAQP